MTSCGVHVGTSNRLGWGGCKATPAYSIGGRAATPLLH
jgi:hypothetical protein